MKASDFSTTDGALTELAWWLEAAFASDADPIPWRESPLSSVTTSAIVVREHRNFFIDTPFLLFVTTQDF